MDNLLLYGFRILVACWMGAACSTLRSPSASDLNHAAAMLDFQYLQDLDDQGILSVFDENERGDAIYYLYANFRMQVISFCRTVALLKKGGWTNAKHSVGETSDDCLCSLLGYLNKLRDKN